MRLIHDTDVGLPTINGYGAYCRYDRSRGRLAEDSEGFSRGVRPRRNTSGSLARTRIRSIAGSSPIGPHAISSEGSVPMSCLLAFRSWWRRLHEFLLHRGADIIPAAYASRDVLGPVLQAQ